MVTKRPLTPQEKKALSYAKDRRESFGQNDKASRRLVPKHKAEAHRKLRRVDKQALMDAQTAAELLPLELQKPEWRKSPGTSLGDHVEERLEERALLDANPVTSWPGRGRLHGLKYPERSETLAARTVEIFEGVQQALKMKRGE